MLATDASCFKIIGWGCCYLVTVMDDYSRFILSHQLQRDMTAGSLIEVVQEAVDKTDMAKEAWRLPGLDDDTSASQLSGG